MAHQITLIPGDGIGPEITRATTKIIENTGLKIDWEVVEAGMTALEKYRDPLPKEVIDSIDKIANPSAIILGGVMMLEYIGELEAAKKIEGALARVIERGYKVTKDINPQKYVVTSEFADAVIKEL